MARGDALYANCNVDWPLDPRCRKLTIQARWLNHVIWCLSVKERRSCLPSHYDVSYLAAVVGQKVATVSNQLSLMESLGLIKLTPEKCIYVIGIQKCHKKLKWRDTPYGEDLGNSNENLKGEIEKENEREKEKEIKSKPKKTTFQKPTLDEIKAEFLSKGISDKDEPEKFFDYYTANGWKVGRNSMKDWKATVRNWIRNLEKSSKPKETDHQRRMREWAEKE